MSVSGKFLIPLLMVLSLVQACASTGTHFSSTQLQKMDSLKILRHESPPLMKASIGSKGAAAAGIMFGGLGGAIGGAVATAIEVNAGKEVTERCKLPDFTEAVFRKFTARAPQEIIGWPKMEIVEEPTPAGFPPFGYSVVIDVAITRVVNGMGFVSIASIQISDQDRNPIWQRRIKYTSKRFKRPTNLDELEADNGTLLLDEIDFASDKIVSDFIEQFRSESSPASGTEKT